MNLPAFREALAVLRGATMHTDGKAFMDGVAEILAQRDALLAAAERAASVLREVSAQALLPDDDLSDALALEALEAAITKAEAS